MNMLYHHLEDTGYLQYLINNNTMKIISKFAIVFLQNHVCVKEGNNGYETLKDKNNKDPADIIYVLN